MTSPPSSPHDLELDLCRTWLRQYASHGRRYQPIINLCDPIQEYARLSKSEVWHVDISTISRAADLEGFTTKDGRSPKVLLNYGDSWAAGKRKIRARIEAALDAECVAQFGGDPVRRRGRRS